MIAPQDPDFAARVARSFARQGIMATFGATLVRVAPGEVDIALPVTPEVSQQHGFVHGGVVGMIADNEAESLSWLKRGIGLAAGGSASDEAQDRAFDSLLAGQGLARRLAALRS